MMRIDFLLLTFAYVLSLFYRARFGLTCAWA